MTKTEDKHIVRKVPALLDQHKAPIMEELGAPAFDLLSPREAADELGIDITRLPDIVRQGWLAPAPGKTIGSANLYHRWRVEFAKRYRRRYKKTA